MNVKNENSKENNRSKLDTKIEGFDAYPT